MKKYTLMRYSALLFFLKSTLAYASPETQTARYFESIKKDKHALTKFLYDMPKGGDLHTHQDGAAFSENILQYAEKDNLCLNFATYTVYANPQCPSANLLNNVIKSPILLNKIIKQWSMHHFNPSHQSGHDHFFATFPKFNAIATRHEAEFSSEMAERAGEQNEIYLEIMKTLDNNQSGLLGKELGYDPDFNNMRTKLLIDHQSDFNKILASMTYGLDRTEAQRKEILHCFTDKPQLGCKVKIRYLYQVLREQPPEMVFAQLLAGFKIASIDKRVLGINMVQAEDGKISMRDYPLHMKMVGYLHHLFPNVHISLHAGELNETLVPPDGLKFHIHDAVAVAKAERIGHGVDILSENNYLQCLKTMAHRNILVEINLSSNETILNITGKDHPLPLYLQYEVPLALSTDDEGINREIMTHQYIKATQGFNLGYLTLKNMARNSIAYSFLPGDSLWQDTHYRVIANECNKDKLGIQNKSKTCDTFLQKNEKAHLQWELEKRFSAFEDTITQRSSHEK